MASLALLAQSWGHCCDLGKNSTSRQSVFCLGLIGSREARGDAGSNAVQLDEAIEQAIEQDASSGDANEDVEAEESAVIFLQSAVEAEESTVILRKSEEEAEESTVIRRKSAEEAEESTVILRQSAKDPEESTVDFLRQPVPSWWNGLDSVATD